jgi:ATP-binding cassette subfamily B protein
MLKEFVTNWKYGKPYRKKQFAIIFIFLIFTIVSTVIPLAVRSVIDDIQSGVITSRVIIYFIVIFAAIAIVKILSYTIDYLLNNLSTAISSDKREELLKLIFTASLKRKKEFDDTTVINRILNEVHCFGHLIGIFPVSVINNSMRLIFAVIILSKINLFLFLISLTLIPVIIVLVNKIKNKAEAVVFEQTKQYEILNKFLKEAILSQIDIKQMKAQYQVLSQFSQKNKRYFTSENQLNKIVSMTQEVSSLLFSTLPLLCLIAGIGLTMINKCDIGSSIAFYLYISAFVVPVTNFTDLKINNIQYSKKEEMIQEIISSLIFENINNAELNFECDKVKVNGISFKYNNGKCVDLSKQLLFDKPGVYFLTAKSGLGKTTVLKLMSKLLFSNESKITFDNKDVNDIPESNFFDKVTYLDGTPIFMQGSIEDNITYFGKYNFDENLIGVVFSGDENIDKDKELNIGEGCSLSTGQLQRINILRLFAKGNAQKLIILDEAISGVEEEREKQILKCLKDAFRQSKILFVTHRKSSKQLCDFVIELVPKSVIL